jgi:hypothetical protein
MRAQHVDQAGTRKMAIPAMGSRVISIKVVIRRLEAEADEMWGFVKKVNLEKAAALPL